MGFNNFLGKIFKNKTQNVEVSKSAFVLNGIPYYTNDTSDLYDIGLARSCIHTIATHCAKLQPKHMIDNVIQENSKLQYLLGIRPNKYMSSYDFMYKTVSMLYTSNNAFIFCNYENGLIEGLYPVPYNSLELLENNNDYYARFRCNNMTFVLPYEQLIHIRRHFNSDDFMGSSQRIAMHPTIKMSNAISESVVNGVRNSNGLRGILKASSLVNDADLDKEVQKFTYKYLDISNTSQIAGLDNRLDFQQLKVEPVVINEGQMQAVSNDMFRYFNVSENIVQSKYTESEYNAFYNSCIEPLAIQISIELTSKLFTQNQIKTGNKIILSAERMGFASMDTRVKAIETLMPLGIFSINESRKLMELSDVENGDKHLLSLNYVDLDKANEYQLGDKDNGKKLSS